MRSFVWAAPLTGLHRSASAYLPAVKTVGVRTLGVASSRCLSSTYQFHRMASPSAPQSDTFRCWRGLRPRAAAHSRRLVSRRLSPGRATAVGGTGDVRVSSFKPRWRVRIRQRLAHSSGAHTLCFLENPMSACWSNRSRAASTQGQPRFAPGWGHRIRSELPDAPGPVRPPGRHVGHRP